MQRDFDDLSINVLGSRVGRFSGSAFWDDDGVLDEVAVAAEVLDDKDLVLKRARPFDRYWFLIFEAALSDMYVEDIADWRAMKKERAQAYAAELRWRDAREREDTL